MIKDIKIKNSPEWANNPDKQLWFHATRDWARIYVPDVLMGVYSRDELDADYGRRDQGNTGTIADRLQPRADGAEGFDAQGIAKTLGIAHEVSDYPDAAKEPAEAEATTSPRKRSTKADKAAMAETPAEEAEHVGQALEPATQAEYIAYASKWIGKATDRDDAAARWDGERELRAACKVSVTERKALEKALKAKLETLT